MDLLTMMRGLIIILLAPCCFAVDRESAKNVPELVESDGYPFESHDVTTEDGYILNLHRIPYGKNDIDSGRQRPVVFLGTCLYCSSAAYLLLGPESSLAYKLANSGYDVWIINVRGSYYSRKHVYFSTNSKSYWDFSFHEHGIYDLSASLDYAIKETGVSKVDYIGYSMGSTMFFVLLSERPEYNNKIRVAISIAPSAYQTNSRGIFPTRTQFNKKILQNYEKYAATGEFPLSNPEIGVTLQTVCDAKRYRSRSRLCNSTVYASGGDPTNGNIEFDRLPFFFKFFPDSTSISTVVHYDQLKRKDSFCKFDYGPYQNWIKYRSLQPPQYNLNNIRVPVHLIFAKQDFITTKKDALRIIPVIPNFASAYEVKNKKFAHLDFIWGKDAETEVYNIVLQKIGV